MTKESVGFHERSVAGIPGLKIETWGTLRFYPWLFCQAGLDVIFGAEEMDKQGHHEEDGDDGGQHASYDDAG
jgi:hypothetical protein